MVVCVIQTMAAESCLQESLEVEWKEEEEGKKEKQ